MFVVKIFR